MRVGIISNTHAPASAVAAAADLLLSEGAEVLLHCGDLGGRHVLDVLSKYDAEFIWGDRDTDRMGILRYATKLKLVCHGVLASVDLAGKRVAMCHGDDAALAKRFLDEQDYDYLFTGHRPETEDYRAGKTRVVNPGSLAAGGRGSVALVDLAADEVRFYEMDVSPT